jgi:hypothetical protein
MGRGTSFHLGERQVCVWFATKQKLCPKIGNPEPHQYTNHRKIKENYPPKSAVPEKKVDELKSGLKARQSDFTRTCCSK